MERKMSREEEIEINRQRINSNIRRMEELSFKGNTFKTNGMSEEEKIEILKCQRLDERKRIEFLKKRKDDDIRNKNDIWARENGYEDIDDYYKRRDFDLIKRKKFHKYGSDYKRGNLDPNSNVGFAFISQRVVAKVLGLELINDCNCEFGFDFKYDLYDENEYNSINVKASVLCKNVRLNYWNFSFENKYEPDTYILVGYSIYKEDILHVWILSPDIHNTKDFKYINVNHLYKYKQYEVDAEPYNRMYHSMSIGNCKVLRS